jgi:hypothetical protein
VEGFTTPDGAASVSMPPKIMQLVHSQISADRQTAWVLLAVEVAGRRTTWTRTFASVS